MPYLNFSAELMSYISMTKVVGCVNLDYKLSVS